MRSKSLQLPRLPAPLTAITAAVVGVIASIALFFIAYTAILPGASGTFGSRVDGVALLRYKLGVIQVIAACGVAGLVAKMLAWT